MNVTELILSHPAVDIAAALVDRLDEELDKLPPEERAKHFFSAEEVFAELGIPEPSEEERQKTHRQMCREVLVNSLRMYQMLEKYMNKQ